MVQHQTHQLQNSPSADLKNNKKMYPAVYLIVSAVALVILWLRQTFYKWRARGFPQVDGTFPYGSLQGVGSNRTRFQAVDSFYKLFKGRGPAVGYYSFFNANLLLLDPSLIKNVITKDFSSFHDRSLYKNKHDDPVSAK
jgi:cytochrome P450 family 6